jgi:hypothetical protein
MIVRCGSWRPHFDADGKTVLVSSHVLAKVAQVEPAGETVEPGVAMSRRSC